ncbi:MAG: methionine--tRNA ligase [Flavobacteriales bacterium]|nr:methionine--tRNA ligase [Flavobacteriales bacterium]MBP9079730.1 methionine--tRNA ligase [Flavobacteriales bacterium]
MKAPARTTVTAALPYANGPLHIGHIAGAYLPADIYVRNLRARNKEVLFICGSDEHGAAITLRALKEGTTPQAIVDKYHALMGKAFADFGITFDIYHRTSSELHRETSQEFFLQLNANGAFTENTEEQYYDTEAKQFLADRYIMGTCPTCGNPDAYGDQCEKCGSALSPKDLIDPRSTLSGSKPVLRPTKHWYLPMERSQHWMQEWINTGMLDGAQQHDPAEWKPQVLGQCNSWLKEGLRPRAMTRDLTWGVPVPLPGAEGKALYVWLDAPIGYISATKQWAADQAAKAPGSSPGWEKWWKAEDTRLLHFIGKDNIVFHCIIFPILLKEHGGFILPQNVPANEFLNLEGRKLSTSRNWAVWLHEYIERWPGRQDELRYALATILPEFKDSEFTWKDFQDKNNNELVAIIGNFVQRVFVLCNKYYEGRVPEPAASNAPQGEQDTVLWAELSAIPGKVAEDIGKFRFRDALLTAMNAARLGNKYLTDTEPWKLEKTDPDRVRTVLFNGLRITAALSVVLEPFLPFTAQKLRTMLGLGELKWADALREGLIVPGAPIGKAEHLFKPITDAEIAAEVERLKANEPREYKKVDEDSPSAPPRIEHEEEVKAKPNIAFDDFTKLDIRIGTITAAERVPKADKLLKLAIDVGEGTPRTIVSGIAQHFTPEELPGKQVLVLCNLEPRKMRGVESQGMVLMAEDAEGKLVFVQPGREVPPGAEVR